MYIIVVIIDYLSIKIKQLSNYVSIHEKPVFYVSYDISDHILEPISLQFCF